MWRRQDHFGSDGEFLGLAKFRPSKEGAIYRPKMNHLHPCISACPCSQLATKQVPNTVSSMKVDRVDYSFTEDDGASIEEDGSATLVDFPGHASIRPQLRDEWKDVRGVALVIDSSLPGDHLRDAAE